MIRVPGVAALVLSSVALTAAFAAEAPATVTMKLERLKASDAATTLRTIAGVRSLSIVDEHTVSITEAPEAVELARTVIDMAEHPSEVAEEIPTRSASDGTVIASVQLRRASAPKVMTALRREVEVRRIATITPSSIIVRDVPDKVAAALALIRQMEAEPSQGES